MSRRRNKGRHDNCSRLRVGATAAVGRVICALLLDHELHLWLTGAMAANQSPGALGNDEITSTNVQLRCLFSARPGVLALAFYAR